MESYYLELIKWGGGTALIIALIFLVREIGSIWKNKDGKEKWREWREWKEEEFFNLKEKVENEYYHLFKVLEQDIKDLRQEVGELYKRFNQLENRVNILEYRINKINRL